MILKILLLTIFLSGCIIAPPMPKLPEFKPAICPKAEPVVCQSLLMPDPIPKTAFIDIRNGQVVKIDSGGESLIRNYAATRKAIKASNHFN